MKNTKRLLALLLALMMILPLAACGSEEDNPEPDAGTSENKVPTSPDTTEKKGSIELAAKSAVLTVGQTLDLSNTYILRNCKDTKVTYETSDRQIATVTPKGVVTAVSAGEATITLAVDNGMVKAEMKLTVKESDGSQVKPDAPVIELSFTEISMTEGDSAKITYVLKNGTEDTVVSFASSSDAVTVSDNGVIEAVSEGTAVITVSVTGGKSVTVSVSVEKAVSSIDLSFTEITLNVGESKQISYTLYNCKEGTVVSFATSSVAAKVNANGLIEAVSEGTAVITVSAIGCEPVTIKVTVNKPVAPESSVPHYEPTLEEGVTYVDYSAKNVKHVFFHNLIAFEDTTRHFDKDCLYVSEFKAILEQLYDNNYVLINIDYIYDYYEEDGALKAKLRDKIKVPKGKIPLIMSVDNVCYPANEHGLGRVDRLVVKNGKLYTYTKLKDGSDYYSDDNEVFTILENFIELHPDFSFSGARMVVAPSGYAGLFGYNTTSGATAAQKAEAAVEVPKIVDWFRGNGYTFACHSYSHGDFNAMSVDQINADFEKWDREVLPYIGKTHVFIYPYGNFTDLRKEGGKERAEALFDKGFAVYCATSMNGINWDYKVSSSAVPLYLGICYNERIILDGQCLRKYADHANMKALFDAYSVYDNSQREIQLVRPGVQTSITLNKAAVTLEIGKSVQLEAKVEGLTAKVIFSSDNPCVSVDENGNITAVSTGRAKITATCGVYTATCTVTVPEPKPEPKIELNCYHITLNVGESIYLTATSNVEGMTFVWTASNEEAVFVDDGNVRALLHAEAVIVRATASDGSCYAECMIDIV